MNHPDADHPDSAYPEGERTIHAPISAPIGAKPVGHALEGYRIGSLLGRGGEGEVHEARQLSFGRTVAIKTLRPGRADERQIQRFHAEAAITALLEHPNIVPVHDLRVDGQGHPQLVMKRVSGRTWRALIETGAMSIDEHVGILLKVCDAIEFAHGMGILHRDLKPENVMVGEHGEVLVMDWGCAVHVGPTRPHPLVPLLSDLSGTSGTPSYMSPEQARAEHAACGRWSDVHLLGACLYHVLAGSAPRRGATVRGILASAMCGDPIEDPGIRAGKRVSLELGAVAMAALHADPDQRTPTAAVFAKALRRYLDHREVLELVADARREHDHARSGGPAADDAFRRAICAVEQAVRLWPELVAARRLEVVLDLDAARHAASSGALQQAQRLAGAARAAAERLGDQEGAQQAIRLAAQAAHQERMLQRRGRTQRQLRLAASIAATCAALSLVIGMLLVWHQSARTTEALAIAQTNLERANRERTAREAGERLATPALLAQARELSQQLRFADGIPLVDVAIGFAPGDPQPLILKAQLLVALKRRPEAMAVLDAALAFKPDADAAELRRLCADPSTDAEGKLAEVLVRMGARAMAGALNLAADQRAAIAIAQLRKAWPTLLASSVHAQSDGTLALNLPASDLRIDSLEPLRGLPISSLVINDQEHLRDFGPLHGLPLTTLIARGTGVRDFAPLRGLPLRRLSLCWYERGFDLEYLRGARLELLDAPGSNCKDLAALTGMPLQELRLYGCNQLTDISALKSMPLTILTLDAPKPGVRTLTDLSPLTGMAVADLGLAWQQGITSIAPLRGQQLRRLILNGTGVSDLSPALTPALRHLAIGQTPITDLRPLLDTQVEVFDFSPQNIKQGMDAVLELPSLRLACGYSPADFRRWFAFTSALAAVNPGFPWAVSAVFAEGRPIELRILSPVKSLAPVADLAPLRVLHMTGPITDLRPLRNLSLVELVFAPTRDTEGLEAIRRMTSLQRIGSSAQALRPPAEFWRDFDNANR